MSVELTTQRSRRQMLSAAGGTLVALAASALGRPLTTRAATGDNVVAGQTAAADAPTIVTNSTLNRTLTSSAIVAWMVIG